MIDRVGKPLDERMNALRLLHDELAEAIPKDRPLIYLDYPRTKNIGDLLILLGTLEFFRRYKFNVRLSRMFDNTPPRSGLGVQPGDTIILHGGGNFGDLYPHNHAYRERIIQEYPDHKILIFPQTAFYSDSEKLKRNADILNGHPDLTLYVRDRTSESLLRPYLGERVRLMPDMAHQLWPSLHHKAEARKKGEDAGPLILMRTDKEAGGSFATLDAQKENFVDWDDVNYKSLSVWKRVFDKIASIEGSRNMSLGAANLYFGVMQHEVEKVSRKLALHDVWITSRMHGGILGLLLNKRVFAVDNNYGKLSSYIDTWFHSLENIEMISSEEDAERAFAFARQYRATRDAE